jgi:AraC family transcriptional regulator
MQREDESGLAFLQREQKDVGHWEGQQSGLQGLYHLVILSRDCFLNVRFGDHLRYHGHFPAGSIQFATPVAEAQCAGIGPNKFLQISFTPAYLAAHLSALGINSDGVELHDVRSNTDFGLSHLTHAYEAALSCGFSGMQLYFDVMRQAIFNQIVNRHAAHAISTRSYREVLAPVATRRVVEYIEANLTRDLRLHELCAIARSSKAHFARAFRNTMGIAPHTFVLQRRLARAIDLLRLPRLSISEVAQRCGFADHAHLARSFRRHFGYAPSQHHQRLRRVISSGTRARARLPS